MIKIYFCIVVTCLFTLLAMYSLEYTEQKNGELGRFIDAKLAEYENNHRWSKRQQAIADLWNITQEQAAQPVILWE